MLAADPWVVVTAVATVVILVLTWLLVVEGRRRSRLDRERRAEEAAADRARRAEETAAADVRAQAATAAAADAELVGRKWHFEFRLRVAVGDAAPTEPPVEIRVKGANVWVHEVRLTWKPSQPPIAYWATKDAPCPPWGDVSLPYQLNSGGRALKLGWPGPNPEEQAQITQKLKVVYSALRDGPKHEREAEGGYVGWQ
jgi:hypothetical protein